MRSNIGTAAGSAPPTRAAKARASENKMASRSNQQLEHFPNLVTMFLTRAREQGDKPFLSAKRDGHVAGDQLCRGRAPGRGARRQPQADRAPARRPRHAGQREPPRMAHRRPRHHGRGLRHGADLHHQHDARSPAHPQQFGRGGGHRLDAEAGARTDARGAVRLGLPPHHLDRPDRRRPVARRRAIPSLGRPRRAARATSARSRRAWPASAAATSPA